MPFQVSAFAHYCSVKDNSEWWCPIAVGLGTNVTDGVQVMLGTGARVRVIPETNSFYVTLGGIYGQRKRLNDDYAGRVNPTLPADVTLNSVLTNRYGFGWFVGISFGFFGSESKFKGVYPGNADAASSAEKVNRPAEKPAQKPEPPPPVPPAPSNVPPPAPPG